MNDLPFSIVPSRHINAEKWDRCVAKNGAGRIYARHIYLQHLADNWSGLVMGDYEAVMPLVWRKKWGLKYAYSAPFIQQLGLFGSYQAADVKKAVAAATHYLRYGDLFLNAQNAAARLPNARAAANFIIPLSKDYQQISEGYNSHLKIKLRKAAAQQLVYSAGNNVMMAVQTYRRLYGQRFSQVAPVHYIRLAALADKLQRQQQCLVRSVAGEEGNVLATALLFKDENRLYNILPSTTPEGRKASAMHFLIDNVIREFAGTPLLFDFEGSDVPGIATFYQSFGAVNEPYFHLHFNRLPLPFRWLKR